MKTSKILLMFYIFDIIFASTVPEVKDLTFGADFPKTFLTSGYYFFRMTVTPEDEINVITTVSKSNKITVKFIFSETYMSDAFLFTTQNYKEYIPEYSNSAEGYSQKYKIAIPANNKYFAINIYFTEDQDLTLSTSSVGGVSVGLIILIILLPCICVTLITLYILRKCCGILGGSLTSSTQINDPYNQGNYVPPGQGLY